VSLTATGYLALGALRESLWLGYQSPASQLRYEAQRRAQIARGRYLWSLLLAEK
jgi:hypothetical protein